MFLMWGLRNLQEKRLLQNTPLSRIRSAAMGIVALSGTARPRQLQRSPFTGRDVCWWRFRVEEERSNGKTTYWATVLSRDCNDVLYLDDPTGSVLVNPTGAQLQAVKDTFY